jgi:hypothetical protein
MPPTGDKRATTPRCPVSFRQQSQFPATPGGARPEGRGAMGRTRKTKPIPGEGWWDEAQGDVRHGRVRTNPICPSQMGRHVCGGLREPPLFQYSRIPPFQSDAYLQNKAKLGRTGVSGGQDGGDERRANAPNKPNFGHGKANGKWFAEKELRPIWPAKSTGKTKPIPGRAGSGQGPARSIVRHRLDAPLRETNPIPRLRIADRAQTCAATPFAGRWAEGQLYKQTQLAGANRAKRTQLPEAGHRGGVRLGRRDRSLGDAGRGQSCKTKPIFDLHGEPMGPAPATAWRPHPPAGET